MEISGKETSDYVPPPVYILLPQCVEMETDVFLNILKGAIARKGEDDSIIKAFKSGMSGEVFRLEMEDISTNWLKLTSKAQKIRQTQLIGYWAIDNFPLLGKKLLGTSFKDVKPKSLPIAGQNKFMSSEEITTVIFQKLKIRVMKLNMSDSTLAKLKCFVQVPNTITKINEMCVSPKMTAFDLGTEWIQPCWQALKFGNLENRLQNESGTTADPVQCSERRPERVIDDECAPRKRTNEFELAPLSNQNNQYVTNSCDEVNMECQSTEKRRKANESVAVLPQSRSQNEDNVSGSGIFTNESIYVNVMEMKAELLRDFHVMKLEMVQMKNDFHSQLQETLTIKDTQTIANDKTEHNCQAIKGEITQLNREIHQMSVKLEEAEKTITGKDLIIGQKMVEANQLQEELFQEKKNHQETNEKMQHDWRAMRDEVAQLNREIHQMSAELEDAKKSLTGKDLIIGQKEVEAIQLQEELLREKHNRQETNEKMDKDLQAMKSQVTLLNDEIRRLYIHLTDAKNCLAGKDKEINILKNTNEELRKDLETLNNLASNLTSELSEQIGYYDKKFNASEDAEHTLKEELIQVKAEVTMKDVEINELRVKVRSLSFEKERCSKESQTDSIDETKVSWTDSMANIMEELRHSKNEANCIDGIFLNGDEHDNPTVQHCRREMLQLRFGWIKFKRHQRAKYSPGFTYSTGIDGVQGALKVGCIVDNAKTEYFDFKENVADSEKDSSQMAALNKFNNMFQFSYH